MTVPLAKEGTKTEIIAKVTDIPESQVEHILKKSTEQSFFKTVFTRFICRIKRLHQDAYNSMALTPLFLSRTE